MDAENQVPSDSGGSELPSDFGDQTTPPADPTPSQPPKEKSSNKKMWTIVLIILAILLLGAAAWYFFLRDDSTSSTNQDNTASSEQAQDNDTSAESEQGVPLLNEIVYAHSDKSGQSRPTYYRLVSGGERISADASIGSYDSVSSVVRQGDHYAYVQGNQVWYGNGKDAPKKVYEVDNAVQQITTIALNSGGQGVAIGLADGTYNSTEYANPQIFTVATSGGAAVKYFEGAKDEGNGLYPQGYNVDNGEVYFYQSCYGCGGISNPDILTVKDDKAVVVIKQEQANSFLGTAFSSDYSQYAYLESTTYTEQQIKDNNISADNFINDPNGPPYKLHLVNVSDGSDSVVATIGKIEDAADNKTVLVNVTFGFRDSGEVVAYSYQNKVFLQNSGNDFSNVFETGQGNISTIYYVSDKEVLVGSPAADSGEIISHFIIEGQKANTVMETGEYSVVLGLTSQ